MPHPSDTPLVRDGSYTSYDIAHIENAFANQLVGMGAEEANLLPAERTSLIMPLEMRTRGTILLLGNTARKISGQAYSIHGIVEYPGRTPQLVNLENLPEFEVETSVHDTLWKWHNTLASSFEMRSFEPDAVKSAHRRDILSADCPPMYRIGRKVPKVTLG